MTQQANYVLRITADSGYISTTEGRCTAEQYADAVAALAGGSLKQEPLAVLRKLVNSLEWAAVALGDIPPKSNYMESLQEARDLIAKAGASNG